MKDLLDRYLLNPHWRTIKIVGQAKVLGISATTIIVVPLLSRILIKLNEMETSIRQAHPAFDTLFPLIKYHFELPLSIKLLVGSAVCALVGKVVYEMGCPVYIKEGNTFEEFRQSQARATDTIADAFLKVMQGKGKEKVVSGLQALHFTFAEPSHPTQVEWKRDTVIRLDHLGKGIHPKGSAEWTMRYSEVASAVFAVIRDVMDDSRKSARIICAMLYAAAFLLLLGTLALQLVWVVRGMLL